MPEKYKPRAEEKDGLHVRNKHRLRYNFDELIQSCPALGKYVSLNQYHHLSINFSDPDAVKVLNKALLQHFYNIGSWDIPTGYLCPPIPGRADYIHYMADLLASCNNGAIPTGKQVTALDIGVGANCVYPLIGHHEYGWQFVGADVDPVAIRSAKQIVTANNLINAIELRLQTNPADTYNGIIQPGEFFDLTICNPPFHASQRETEQGTRRKLNNLGKQQSGKKPVLNFGGQNTELWCPGGEEAFVRRMIEQSAQMPTQVFWYSTLISKKDNLPSVYHNLKRAGAFDIKTISMSQGQKVSRIVAWTFLNDAQQKEWSATRWK